MLEKSPEPSSLVFTPGYVRIFLPVPPAECYSSPRSEGLEKKQFPIFKGDERKTAVTMLRSAIWPVGKDKAARLKRFHESEYWPQTRAGRREHEVSSYWRDAVGRIHTDIREDLIKIDSLSHYLGPEQIKELTKIRIARQRRLSARVLIRAGKLGKYVPRDVWRILWNPSLTLANAIFRVHDFVNEVRTAQLAREAFFKIHKSDLDPTISLGNLKKLPVLADQSESSLWMVLYISTVINTLAPYIKKFDINNVLEIGPGWGILSICLHQLHNCRFILVDLPEILSATFAMISYYRPNALVVLPNELKNTMDYLQKGEFVLICPEQSYLIPSDSVDMAINTSSFQEMTYSLIEEYFKLVKRCLRRGGLFYCLNEKKFKRHRVGGPIEYDQYPWDPGFDDIFHEEFAFGRLSNAYERIHRLQVKG